MFPRLPLDLHPDGEGLRNITQVVQVPVMPTSACPVSQYAGPQSPGAKGAAHVQVISGFETPAPESTNLDTR
jgi:hypothetical protein